MIILRLEPLPFDDRRRLWYYETSPSFYVTAIATSSICGQIKSPKLTIDGTFAELWGILGVLRD